MKKLYIIGVIGVIGMMAGASLFFVKDTSFVMPIASFCFGVLLGAMIMADELYK